MYQGVTAAKSDKHKLEEAFDRSRGAAIVLGITTVFTGGQAAFLFFTLPAGAWELAAQGDETSAIQVVTACYVTLYFLIALTTMLCAWLMRSRIAMGVGLLLYGLNWLNFVLELMAGNFAPAGFLMNIVGPVYLVRSFIAAQTYHALKRTKPVDPEVFA